MPRALAALLAIALATPPALPVARAQVRRCETGDGRTVYTDRRCDALGAVEAPMPSAQPRLRTHRTACARSVRDLYFELSSAIESRDVNRLAGIYHWPGMSTRAGFDVMQRLQAIVDRPLVDLQPVYPGGEDALDAPRRAPSAFRVEQTTANGITPVRAVLGLRRHLDCWWITLGGARPPAPRPASPTQGAPGPDDDAGDAQLVAPSIDAPPAR